MGLVALDRIKQEWRAENQRGKASVLQGRGRQGDRTT